MTCAPEQLDASAELAADALESISFQSSVAARFLRRGDDIAAIETFRRILALQREFVTPAMRTLQAAIDPATQAAAIEWRRDRDEKARRA